MCYTRLGLLINSIGSHRTDISPVLADNMYIQTFRDYINLSHLHFPNFVIIFPLSSPSSLIRYSQVIYHDFPTFSLKGTTVFCSTTLSSPFTKSLQSQPGPICLGRDNKGVKPEYIILSQAFTPDKAFGNGSSSSFIVIYLPQHPFQKC